MCVRVRVRVCVCVCVCLMEVGGAMSVRKRSQVLSGASVEDGVSTEDYVASLSGAAAGSG